MKIEVGIDVTKIDKSRITEGKNGSKWLNLVLVEFKGEMSDGFVKMKETKEEREERVKLPIIGNFKIYPVKETKSQTKPAFREDEEPPF